MKSPRLSRLSSSVLLAFLLAGAGCPGSQSDGSESGTTTATETASATETGGTMTTTTTGDTETTESTGMTGNLPPIPAGCNPIAYENDCLLPYPSDFFAVPDADMPNGVRIELTPAATPLTLEGKSFNFLEAEPSDGASHHMPILALFPEGIDTSNLNFHLDGGEASVLNTSPSVLLNTKTGEFEAHWVELDVMAEGTSQQALILRTFAPLEPSTRYIVAYQGLVSVMGTDIEPPAGFAHLLSGEVAGHPVLEPLLDRYQKDIFGPLEAAGVAQDNLQLAWDFTTASEERNTGDMLAIRDDILATFADDGPAVKIDAAIDSPNNDIALRIEGRIEVPLYLESDQAMARLYRNAKGEVVANGTHWVDFTLQVPTTVFPIDPQYTPARIVQFGHGFFGEREEINWSAMREFSTERGMIMIATDWVGMSKDDLASLVEYIDKRPAETFVLTDRLHQAFANQLALSFAVKTTLAQAPELEISDQTIYNPDELYWYGISQGSIFGVVFMALTPTIQQSVLNVGGGPYSLMMTRSGSFRDLFTLIQLTIGDNPLTLQKYVALSQHAFDRVDPSTYASHMLLDPYPQSPDKQIIFQYGIGDHLVNNLASHVILRAAGIDMIEPTTEVPYGIGTVKSPTTESAAIAVDYQLAELPGIYAEIPDDPPKKDDVHELVRRNPKIRDQIDAFFTLEADLINFCDGPCDPE